MSGMNTAGYFRNRSEGRFWKQSALGHFLAARENQSVFKWTPVWRLGKQGLHPLIFTVRLRLLHVTQV